MRRQQNHFGLDRQRIIIILLVLCLMLVSGCGMLGGNTKWYVKVIGFGMFLSGLAGVIGEAKDIGVGVGIVLIILG